MSFVHLQVHSEYSLQDSLLKVNQLVAKVKEEKMPAVALSDVDNLFAFVKFYQACIKQAVKPICAVELTIRLFGETGRVILIAKNNAGYKALLQLVSFRYTKYDSGVPIDAYPELCENLIVILSPWDGLSGQLIQSRQEAILERTVLALKKLFPKRIYLGLLRWGLPASDVVDAKHIQLCNDHQIAPVALGAVCFLEEADFDAHEVRVCIHAGRLLSDPSREKKYDKRQAFSGTSVIEQRFADVPIALSNAYQIAKAATVTLEIGSTFLPEVSVRPGETVAKYFETTVQAGYQQRFAELPSEMEAEYTSRLRLESDIIIQMGFASYFLIVADFIAWAKKQQIPVGPGRGSGAGSLVAYVLGITDIEPIKYGLLFERFLNPERVSMPDFDIDFCMEKRDDVIAYVAEKYGHGAVSQIITYGTMAAKAVIRDVGRVLGQPYGFMDKLAKLVPFEIGMTLTKAMEKEQELARLYQTDAVVKQVIDLSMQLEGMVRNVGRHAGGVVIAPGQLTDFSALYQESIESPQPVTQFDKDDIEKIGLVKFDFLGLRTLTIIDWACKTIRKRHSDMQDFKIENILLDDPKTFKLVQACNTTGVFQVESRGMKELIARLVPDCFEDLIALVALYRPGPLQSGMVDDFIDRKHGRAQIEYPHDSLSEILKPTYGVILYQEQVMQIAQVLSGYTLGNADLLRRAMGKKKVEEMEAQRAIFIKGAEDQGVCPKQAGGIFDLVEKFAGYGFNKSHSAAYAMITYQTAWLKANYPDALMSAVLSSDMDNTDKVVGFYEDTLKQGIKIQPVCVNASQSYFHVESHMVIRYGLGAIKGVGESFAQAVVDDRARFGPYTDVLDFCMRLEHVRVNRKMLEALIKAGALDCFKHPRAALYASIEKVLAKRDKKLSDQSNFQGDLLGDGGGETEWLIDVPDWDMPVQLNYERDVLGLYLSSHPMIVYRPQVKALGAISIAQIKRGVKNQLVAGVLLGCRVVYTKAGRRFVIVSFEDEERKEEILLADQEYQRVQGDLQPGGVLIFEVNAQSRADGTMRLACDRIWTIEQRQQTIPVILTLGLTSEALLKSALELEVLVAKLDEGTCAIKLQIIDTVGKILIPCGHRVKVTQDFLDQLKKMEGVTVKMERLTLTNQ